MTALLFVEPTTPAETLAALEEYGDSARLLAGGTAVVLLLQQKLIDPSVLISLAGIPTLQGIAVDESGALHIGAMTSLTQVASDKRVRAGWPLLADACGVVASVRLRNQATLGGNIAEADYASDPPAALVALDGVANILGPDGEREIALAEFFLGFYTTALAEGELLTEIVVPAMPAGMRSSYIKYKSRSSEDRPCVGVAATLAAEEGVCRHVRVAIGAACEIPQRFPELEQALLGQPLTPTTIADFAQSYAEQLADPIDDLRGSAWYRRRMTAVHLRRALAALADGEAAA